MKNARPFEGVVSDKSTGELSDHKRLSILRWNAGPKSGEITNRMVGSIHVIVVQEAETHYHEIIASAEQQFYTY